MTDAAGIARLERVEAEAIGRMVEAASPSTRSSIGIRVDRLDEVVVSMLRHDRSGFWNRAIGFARPVTRDLVARVIDLALEHGLTATRLSIAPAFLPADWSDIAAEFGLVERTGYLKLAGDAETVARSASTTTLRLGPVTAPAEVAEAGRLLAVGFGYDERHTGRLYADAAGSGAVRMTAAWDGDRMVSAAVLSIVDDAAELWGAGTLPAWRGRGAQTALVRARAEDAVAAGCTTIVAETSPAPAGGHNPSLSVMTRAGLRVIYRRPHWDWQRDR